MTMTTTPPRLPGTYRLWVGGAFYIGSTVDLARRWADHRLRLERGEHPVAALQQAWDAVGGVAGGEACLEVFEVMPRKPGESDAALRRRLRLHEQWMLDVEFGRPGCCNRSSSSGFNSGAAETMAEKWADIEWRTKQIAAMQEGRKRAGVSGVSQATREKMSLAKKGGRNTKAKACWLRLGDEERRFDCVTAGAEWLGVKQQVLDLWIRGVVPWPGTGKRASRYARLTGLTGGWVG